MSDIGKEASENFHPVAFGYAHQNRCTDHERHNQYENNGACHPQGKGTLDLKEYIEME